MSCSCDQFVFPSDARIAAGLTRMPRQTGTFAEFRRALLHAASIRSTANLEHHPLWSLRYLNEPDRNGLKRTLDAIGAWRGRHPEDFVVMLIEMWAYVCDLTSFYDDAFAHECFVRTARRRDSLRGLVDVLGYLPRPAVAALADLAASADGRRAVTLPVGTAFRSGAFNGNPPQVFELGSETVIHPLLNEWKLLPVKPETFGAAPLAVQILLCKPNSVSVKEGDVVLVKIGQTRNVLTVDSVANQQGADGATYSAVKFSSFITVPADTPVNSVKLLKPAATSSLWARTPGAYGPVKKVVSGWQNSYLTTVGAYLHLESISGSFRSGQDVIVSRGDTYWAAGIVKVTVVSKVIESAKTIDISGDVTATVTVPEVSVQTTGLEVQPMVLDVGEILTLSDDAGDITVHHSFVEAGKVTIEALSELSQTESLHVGAPIEHPRDALAPGVFELEDKNNSGIKRPASLNFVTGEFTVRGDPWPETLVTPVKLFGNIVTTSRGETVNGEWLGSGDAAVPNQSFKLKKSPLTYLPAPSENTASGLTSTLKVYVDGLQWAEVPFFYGAQKEDQTYIVRENEKGESIVTFGDGVLGRRLSTGAQVIAYYRHGAGGVMPPSGSITQVAHPVKGLKSVRSPVAPYGGADAESAESLRKFAPRSALLLGRAVSLRDLEAAAITYSGIRAVSAEWRWSGSRQVPAAHIWYLAEGDLTELLTQKLRSLTQPDTPIQVEPAAATPTTLSIQLTTNPRRFENEVLAAARLALMDPENGLLPPERLGIGQPLFRSQLFDFLMQVPGVVSITGLNCNGNSFEDYGIKPDAGCYFDFTNSLILNGRTE